MTFVSLQLLSLKVKSSKEFSPPSSSSFPFSFFGQKEKWAFFWADDSLRSCYLHLGLYFLLGRGIWNVCWLEKMRRAAKFLSFSLLLSSEDVAAVESVFLGSCYAFSNIEGRDNCFWFEIHTEHENHFKNVFFSEKNKFRNLRTENRKIHWFFYFLKIVQSLISPQNAYIFILTRW